MPLFGGAVRSKTYSVTIISNGHPGWLCDFEMVYGTFCYLHYLMSNYLLVIANCITINPSNISRNIYLFFLLLYYHCYILYSRYFIHLSYAIDVIIGLSSFFLATMNFLNCFMSNISGIK